MSTARHPPPGTKPPGLYSRLHPGGMKEGSRRSPRGGDRRTTGQGERHPGGMPERSVHAVQLCHPSGVPRSSAPGSGDVAGAPSTATVWQAAGLRRRHPAGMKEGSRRSLRGGDRRTTEPGEGHPGGMPERSVHVVQLCHPSGVPRSSAPGSGGVAGASPPATVWQAAGLRRRHPAGVQAIAQDAARMHGGLRRGKPGELRWVKTHRGAPDQSPHPPHPGGMPAGSRRSPPLRGDRRTAGQGEMHPGGMPERSVHVVQLWHPSGVSRSSAPGSGGVAGAPPPATVWQAAGLRRRHPGGVPAGSRRSTAHNAQHPGGMPEP